MLQACFNFSDSLTLQLHIIYVFFVFISNVSVSISFERLHFHFYNISVFQITIVSVSVNVGWIISVSVIVSVTEISLESANIISLYLYILYCAAILAKLSSYIAMCRIVQSADLHVYSVCKPLVQKHRLLHLHRTWVHHPEAVNYRLTTMCSLELNFHILHHRYHNSSIISHL